MGILFFDSMNIGIQEQYAIYRDKHVDHKAHHSGDQSRPKGISDTNEKPICRN